VRFLLRPDVAFWWLVVLAVGIGGVGALTLSPGVFVPGGFSAEAHGQANAGFVALPLSGLPHYVSEDRAGSAVTRAHRLPAIAIVIDDMGSDVVQNRRAIALTAAVALSFLPYPEDTPALAREAARAGHDILVHVPMQAESRAEDPGPMALLIGLPPHEIIRRLDWALSRVPGYIGINNHMGSRFTQNRAALVPVAERVADHHIFFLDSRTTVNAQVVPVARAFGVPSAARDVFLDDVQDPQQVAVQLAELERDARANGVAIAIGHPHPATLEVLARWCANLKGYRLVPIGVAIRMKTEREAGPSAVSLNRK